MGKKSIHVPLEELVNFQGNKYEVTNAAIQRANQLADHKVYDQEDGPGENTRLSSHTGKPSSVALWEVLKSEINYRYKE